MEEWDLSLDEELERRFGVKPSLVSSELYTYFWAMMLFESFRKTIACDMPRLAGEQDIKGKLALIDYELGEIIKELKRKIECCIHSSQKTETNSTNS